MKTLRLLFVLALCHNYAAFGQTTEWAKQFGGNIDTQSSSVTTDSNSDVIITGYFRGTADFDPGIGVFNLTSNSGSDDIFITKLDSDGNLIWAKAIGSAADDRGNSVTTDNLGNIYVTGTFRNTADFDPGIGVFNLSSNGSEDAFVLKLDSDGNFLWANQIGNESSDFGIAIAVDSNNQVWITGSFFNSLTLDAFTLTSSGLEDIFVCKYNSDGGLMWADRFGGTQRDVPGSIAVDSEQKVIVAGTFRVTMPVGSTSLISAGNNDIFAFKLNTNGVPEWAVRAGSTGIDNGLGVTTFGSNIFIVGSYSATANFGPVANPWSSVSNGGVDALLLKLTSTGAFVWGNGFGGAGNDAAVAVTCNSTGDIHLTGTFEQTVDFYPGTTSFELTSAGLIDTYIQKLNNDGEFIWTKILNSLSTVKGFSIATDAEGNVYTAGNFLSGFSVASGNENINLTAIGQLDGFVHKMSNCITNSLTNLEIVSCNSFNSPSGEYQYFESGIYLDILISNSGCDSLLLIDLEVPETPEVSTDIFACSSYTSPSGNNTWTTSGTYQDIVPASIGCDTLYTIDLYIQTPTGCSGKALEWHNQLGAALQDKGEDIVIDNQGYSYICGHFLGTLNYQLQSGTQSITSAGSNDIFIAKLSPNGNVVWIYRIGGTSSDYAFRIAIDSQNNLYLAGSYRNTVDFDPGPGQFNLTASSGNPNAFVLKLDENGQFIWARDFIGLDNVVAYTISVDVYGDLVVGGFFEGTVDLNPGAGVNNHTSAGDLDLFITKLDQGGNYIWSLTRGSEDTDSCFDIATDNQGNILATGYFSDTVNFNPPETGTSLTANSGEDIFIYKINANGEFIWVKGVGGFLQDRGLGITTDTNGSVLITVGIRSTVDLDPGPGIFNMESINCCGYLTGVLLKLTSDGNFEWASDISYAFTSSSPGPIAPVITDSSNNVYVGSRTSETLLNIRIYNDSGVIIGNYPLTGQNSYSNISGLAIDIDRSVYCLGFFSSTLDLLSQSQYLITSSGNEDVFVLKISDCNNSNDSFETVEACDSFTPPNAPASVVWTTSGIYSYDIINSSGCPDYTVYDLTILNGTTSQMSVSVCDSLQSPSGNFVWYESGTYTDQLTNSTGCDSLITINLTVNSSLTEYNEQSCESYFWPVNGNTYDESGIYTVTYQNQLGCDSTIVLILNISAVGYSETDVVGCDSYTSPSQQYIWTESGTYMDTILTAAGCDSIMTINLTISTDSESFMEASVCDEFVSPSGNLTLTSSGVYTDVIPNAAGCDSTITIDLTISNSFNSSQTLTSCESYFWDVNGATYNNGGTYTASYTTTNGCDSTYVLNLTIPSINNSVNHNGANLSAVLSGASYQWIDCSDNTPIDGATSQFFTATANGSYAVQITVAGCTATSNCVNITTINVENYSFMQQINIYPNPTAGNVIIDVADLNETLSVRTIDVVGQVVSSDEYPHSSNIEYQMPETPGLYFIELMTESGNHALIKIVKL
jgi:hypothetical protein